MKKHTLWMLGACGLLALPTQAADHIDSPAATGEPMADITDVYAFMSEDAEKLNLIVNVSPFSGEDAVFSSAVVYAIHVSSSEAFGEAETEETILCQFYAKDAIECWAGDSYVAGKPGETSGIMSDDGKMRVFAGLREDPFFFNLDGFKETVRIVTEAAPSLDFDDDGCPQLDEATSGLLVSQLQSGVAMGGAGGAPASSDKFAGTNVLSIVIQVDKSLVNASGDILGVWASTHAAK